MKNTDFKFSIFLVKIGLIAVLCFLLTFIPTALDFNPTDHFQKETVSVTQPIPIYTQEGWQAECSEYKTVEKNVIYNNEEEYMFSPLLPNEIVEYHCERGFCVGVGNRITCADEPIKVCAKLDYEEKKYPFVYFYNETVCAKETLVRSVN